MLALLQDPRLSCSTAVELADTSFAVALDPIDERLQALKWNGMLRFTTPVAFITDCMGA